MIFIRFFTLLLVLLVIMGYVSSTGVADFLKSPISRTLVDKYLNKEIKTMDNLHEELRKKHVDISFRTLRRYVSQIKVIGVDI